MSRAQSFPDNRQEFSGEFPRALVSTTGCLGGAACILFLKAELGSQNCVLSFLGPTDLRSQVSWGLKWTTLHCLPRSQ